MQSARRLMLFYHRHLLRRFLRHQRRPHDGRSCFVNNKLVGGWIAPLVIFLVKRQSRFVSFHALQVLLFEGVVILLTMISQPTSSFHPP